MFRNTQGFCKPCFLTPNTSLPLNICISSHLWQEHQKKTDRFTGLQLAGKIGSVYARENPNFFRNASDSIELEESL
jgi:hypothetical protein